MAKNFDQLCQAFGSDLRLNSMIEQGSGIYMDVHGCTQQSSVSPKKVPQKIHRILYTYIIYIRYLNYISRFLLCVGIGLSSLSRALGPGKNTKNIHNSELKGLQLTF